MKSIKRCWSIILNGMMFFLFSGFLHAQDLWTIFNTTNSGIPYNTVHCIEKAPDGTIWIGTEYGLASLLDTTWTVYQTSNSGLPDNSIRTLAFDTLTNSLWIGTFLGGLVQFQDTSWNVFNVLNSALPSNFVRSLGVSPLGDLWVGTAGGLVQIEDSIWYFYDEIETELGSNNIASITLLGEDTLWVGTINGGATLIEGFIWTTYDIATSGIIDNTQLDIEVDEDGHVWLVSPAHGLMFFNGVTWLNFETLTSDIPTNSLSALVLQGGNIWTGSLDTGLVLFQQPSTWEWLDTAGSEIPDNRVNALYWEEEKDRLWIGTQNGGVAIFEAGEYLIGIPEANRLSLKVFPNPGNGLLSLNVGNEWKGKVKCVVMDMEGRSLLEEDLIFSNEPLRLDISYLPNGLYGLLFSDGQHTVMERVIVFH